MSIDQKPVVAAHPLERALFGAFLLVLFWAPLPFASNREWGGALLALLVATISLIWLLLFLTNRVKVSTSLWRRVRLPALMLISVQLWALLQLMPIPATIVEQLSPQAFAWHLPSDWLTLSLDPSRGRYFLLLGCTYTAGFLLTAALVNTHTRLRLLLQLLVLSGVFQATYGAFMVLSGWELGFFVEKYAGRGLATGTFVNRNHYAGYLVMCLAAGIGLLLSQLARDGARSWKDQLRRLLQLLLSPKIRLRVYLAVMVIALVLSRARMGNIAFFTSLGIAGVLALYTGRRFSWRVVTFLSSLFVIDLLILSKWFGFDKLMQRFEQANTEVPARHWSNEYSLDYLADFPLTGSGGGSFYGIFPNYQAPALEGYHEHAHNDYLQFAIELGVPMALVLAGFVALAQWNAYRLQLTRHTPLYKAAGFIVTMTVVWAAIHSLTDFNLQIPANAFTFVVLLSLAFICRELPKPGPNS